MKTIATMMALAASLAAMAEEREIDGREWQDNQRLNCGQEPARAAFSSFPDEKAALRILPKYAPRQLSLDSDSAWRFSWARNPDERQKEFYREDFDDSLWPTIRVPCSWQAAGARNGKGGWGTPIYTNQSYPFAKDVPGGSSVMLEPPKYFTAYDARNPVGSYRRHFKVPAKWDGSDIFLKFDGVDSFFYLWVNGKYVGFAKDSRSPAEFNVTGFVRPGEDNLVALEVYRYSDGAYLEDQDMFRLSGIFRRTWLLARPKERVRDFFATARPVVEGEYGGAWELNVEMDGGTEAALYTWNDELVGRTATGKLTVVSPKLWSAEEPNCYKLVVNNGQEWVSAVFGFRVSEIRNGRYFLNGEKIKLKGANRHETDPMLGHFVTKERHEQDFRLMKEANCNAVRNAHYPQDDYWYYLCDTRGMYVVDEANVESHGYGYGVESLSHCTSWRKMTVARNMAMVERNKNHPSVVIWSYGNEAGPGENFAAARDAIKARDLTRPTHYERDWEVADMEGCQYPSVAWVVSKAAHAEAAKPFYISEYAHCMNNALGNLKDYQDAIESSDVILGATIWDWVDQGLWRLGKTPVLAFGGDFGDQPNDGQFCMNGVLFSDRTPHPAYYEVKHVYQNWTVKGTNFNTRLVVRNKNYFIDSRGVKLRWQVLADGKGGKRGEIDLHNLGPQQEAVYDMPEAAIKALKDAEASVSLRFEFVKDGAVVADDQIDLVDARETRAICDKSGTVRFEQRGGAGEAVEYVFSAGGARFTFDAASGALVSLVREGRLRDGRVLDRELLKAPMGLDVFRAPSSNEVPLGEKWARNGLRHCEAAPVAAGWKPPVVEELAGGALTFSTLATWRGVKGESLAGYGGPQINVEEVPLPLKPVTFAVATRWTVYPNGTASCVSRLRPLGPNLELARIGYSFVLDESNAGVEWFGCGPWENYPDRKSGAFLGRWKADAEEFFTPYARNQDSGNREGTRALRVGGLTLRTLGAPFAFEVNPWTPAELVETVHPPELWRSDKTYLGIYAATRGLGGASCGPGPVERDILRSDRDYDLAFTLSPLGGDLTALATDPAQKPLPELPERVSATGARIVACSSREPGEGEAEHVIDGDLTTIWHSQYGTTMGSFPHSVTVAFDKPRTLKGLRVFGRDVGVNGRVKNCMVEVSSDGKSWAEAARATLANTADAQEILFAKPVVKVGFYRFTALDNHYGDDFASMAEIEPVE